MSLITAGGSREELLKRQKAFNASRYVPTMPEMFQKVSDENQIGIFNVGPWAHKREMGSAGIFFIQACPKDAPHSQPVVLQGMEEEPYPINEVECIMKPKCGVPFQLTGPADGMLLAEQIIGHGQNVAPHSDLRPFGVFATRLFEWDKKSKQHVCLDDEALEKSHVALRNKAVQLVSLASDAYAKGPSAFSEIFQPDWHLWAARFLRKSTAECRWLENSQDVGARENCPMCGAVYAVGIMKCPCGYILDKKRYDEAVSKGLVAA